MRTVNLTPAKVEGMRSPRRVLWAMGVVVLFLSGTRAQSPTAGEYQVKAAFLFNFAKFVEWPASSFSDAFCAASDLRFGARSLRRRVTQHHQGKDGERAQIRG